MSELAVERLGDEWEWERSPEVAVHVVDSVDEAVALHNRLSPRFVASLISESPAEHDRFFATVDAPFVGDGFTRWVDGQYALGTPELGLSNWEHGRILGRGAILSGDSVHTVRYRAHVEDPELTPLGTSRPVRASRGAAQAAGRYSQTPLMSTTRWTAFCENRHRSPSLLSFTIAPLAVTRCCGVMLRFDASGTGTAGVGRDVRVGADVDAGDVDGRRLGVGRHTLAAGDVQADHLAGRQRRAAGRFVQFGLGQAAVEHAHRRQRLELVAAGAAEVPGQVDRDVDTDVGLQADRAARSTGTTTVLARTSNWAKLIDEISLPAGEPHGNTRMKPGPSGRDRGQVEGDRSGVSRERLARRRTP